MAVRVRRQPVRRSIVWPVANEATEYQLPGRPRVNYDGSLLRLLDRTTGVFVVRFGGFERMPKTSSSPLLQVASDDG